jgi:dTDP-4-dehydrorhamnose reductase
VRILLIGGSGQLGSDLREVGAEAHRISAPSHTEVDVTDAGSVERAIASFAPDAVIDAAAFHKVELCEQDPAWSFAVNAVGPGTVAAAASAHGARCVFISSDYVFDGETPDGYAEDDPTRPVNVYGVSKVAGESIVRIASPDPLVVRGSGLFGHAGSSGKGGNFVETMLTKASAGEAISVVDDQTFAPTATHDMAERILLLLERGVSPGVYHAANAGSCSWYAFAQAIFEIAGIEADLSPRSAGEQAVRRPRSSILLDTKSAALGLPPARPWREALAWYLAQRAARRGALA